MGLSEWSRVEGNGRGYEGLRVWAMHCGDWGVAYILYIGMIENATVVVRGYILQSKSKVYNRLVQWMDLEPKTALSHTSPLFTR